MRHIRLRVALFLAAAFLPTVTHAQANFNNYFSIGDSLAAGYSAGALVESHQATSVPALIARQAGVQTFQQPLIGEPGIPAELTLVSLLPNPLIAPKSATPGQPKNLGLARPYNNMAVPGATVVDAFTTTGNKGLHDAILRGRGTQVQQVAGSAPTFVTLWIGNNDVLGAAIAGRAIDGVTLTPTATFRAVYQQIVTALKNTGARIVAANLPDVTTIPYVTTIKPFLTSGGQPVLVAGQTVPLLGPSGPLPASTLVTLAASALLAQGDGIPTALGGKGTPLPDEVLLDPSEVAIIRDHVTVNNQSIRDICAAAGIPVFDLNGLLTEVATTGRDIGGVRLTASFLTGGVFGYDGVHPTDLGYAVLANEWIGVINANGGSLPLVDLGPYLGVSASARPKTATGFEFSTEAQQMLEALFPRLDR
jgi:lysophospholipase L1-like esterase